MSKPVDKQKHKQRLEFQVLYNPEEYNMNTFHAQHPTIVNTRNIMTHAVNTIQQALNTRNIMTHATNTIQQPFPALIDSAIKFSIKYSYDDAIHCLQKIFWND